MLVIWPYFDVGHFLNGRTFPQPANERGKVSLMYKKTAIENYLKCVIVLPLQQQ